jgi:hypothetical protein
MDGLHKGGVVFLISHHIMQVIARWNPSGARRPVLDEAPVYYPTEEVCCHIVLYQYFHCTEFVFAYTNLTISSYGPGIPGHLKIH